MATKLPTPITGAWCVSGLPEEVRMFGVVFRRAKLWTAKPGPVVAQYRQHVGRQSMHMMVQQDGRWVVDHLDDFNPDHGFLLQHFFMDVCAPFQTLFGAR